jgi:hypothetical protein
MTRHQSILYFLRMTQFFDHYLKGAPAPRWMMYVIPAKDKGYDDGMELVMEKDENGKWITPPIGGLLKEDKRKEEEALHRKKQTTSVQE